MRVDHVSTGAGQQDQFSFTKFFVPVAILLVAVPGVSGWCIWNLCQRFELTESQQLKMVGLSGRASHFDEVLRMSAHMAAATGDLSWENRYRKYESELNACFHELSTAIAGSDISDCNSVARTAAANSKLVVMENEAFDHVREGDVQAAAALLSGQEYEKQKLIYSNSITEFDGILQEYVTTESGRHHHRILLAVSLGAFISLSLILMWISLLLRLRHLRERERFVWSIRENRERFAGIFESSKNAIGYCDLQGVLIDVNNSFCRLTGYSKEELLGGMRYQDLTPPEYHEYEADIIKRLLETGEAEEYKKEYARKDDSRISIFLTKFLVKDSDNTPMGLAAVIRDLTPDKQARHKYESILETAIDGFWVIDMQGRILEVNDSYSRMIGYDRNELLSMNVKDVEAAESPAEVAGHIEQIKKNGRHRFATQQRRKDGTLIPLEVSACYL